MNRITRQILVAFTTALLLAPLATLRAAEPERVSLSAIPSPILFRGDATTTYRDPTAIYHNGWFRLFFTLFKIEPDKRPFAYTASNKSRDLLVQTASSSATRTRGYGRCAEKPGCFSTVPISSRMTPAVASIFNMGDMCETRVLTRFLARVCMTAISASPPPGSL